MSSPGVKARSATRSRGAPQKASVGDAQTKRDADYCRDYRAWLLSLSPSERKSVTAMGLGKPDASRHVSGPVLTQLMIDSTENAPDESVLMPYDAEAERAAQSATDHIGSLSEAMADFIHWVVNPHPLGKGGLNPKAVAQRAIMAAWVLRPDVVKNRTLTDLAPLLNTSPDILSEQASKFSRRFGIKGRCQYSARTRNRMRKAKVEGNAGRSPIDDLNATAPSDPTKN